jgi:hypothetical protein
MGWVEHACAPYIRKPLNVIKILVGKCETTGAFGRAKHKLKDSIKTDLRQIES